VIVVAAVVVVVDIVSRGMFRNLQGFLKWLIKRKVSNNLVKYLKQKNIIILF
jgi:hypothetical protein